MVMAGRDFGLGVTCFNAFGEASTLPLVGGIKNSQVSKFGNQEGDGNGPYDQDSESASKHKTSGMMINAHSGAAQEDMPPAGPLSLQTGHESDVQKLKGNPPRRHSASPHRHHQARAVNKVGGVEKKVSLEVGHVIAPNTPGRSRPRASRPDDSPEKGSAVPEIPDDWEKDPSSGDNFTGIFKKVSEERQASSTKVPMITDDTTYINKYHHVGSNKSSKFCCFKWGNKRG